MDEFELSLREFEVSCRDKEAVIGDIASKYMSIFNSAYVISGSLTRRPP